MVEMLPNINDMHTSDILLQFKMNFLYCLVLLKNLQEGFWKKHKYEENDIVDRKTFFHRVNKYIYRIHCISKLWHTFFAFETPSHVQVILLTMVFLKTDVRISFFPQYDILYLHFRVINMNGR